MRWAPTVAAGAVLVLTACSGTGPTDGAESGNPVGEAASECLPRVRYHGNTYYAVGYTTKASVREGKADLARCADVGANAQGSYFPEDGRQSDVYTFRAVPPSRAIAIREGDSYGVYVADGVSIKRAEHLLLTKLDGRFDP